MDKLVAAQAYKLVGLGVDENPQFYYLGNVTVCLLRSNDKVVSRGVSVCSELDKFVKNVGRAKALGRAIRALENKRNDEPISHVDRFNGRLSGSPYLEDAQYAFGYKSLYNPSLTDYEKEVVLQ